MTAPLMSRHDWHTLLASLHVGEQVLYAREGHEPQILTVQHELRRPPGGGSWDHSTITVGYGPGRWCTEVSPAQLDSRAVTLRRWHGGRA